MKKIVYYRAETLNEAYKMLSTKKSEIIAGGTDLIVRLRLGISLTSKLVDISQIKELRKLENNENGLKIGASVTLDELSSSDTVRKYYPALAQAADSVASWQIRNRATIAGNICQDTRCQYYNQSENWRRGLGLCFRTGGEVCFQSKKSHDCVAVYYSDLAPILAALGASVVISGPGGERAVKIMELPVGPGVKLCKNDELIKEIIVPSLEMRTGQVYLREATRSALDFPLCSVAVVIKLYASDHFNSVKIVFGAVAPNLRLIRDASKILRDEGLNVKAYEKIADLGARLVNVFPDYGYSAGYRKNLAQVLIRRALTKSVERALGKDEYSHTQKSCRGCK